jgi:hypothetical protein
MGRGPAARTVELLGGWLVLAAVLCENLGVVWDVQWHEDVGPDTFFTASHLLIYIAPALAGLTSLAVVLHRTGRHRGGSTEDGGKAVTVFGTFRAPVGFLVAGVGAALELVYGMADLWWHSEYGFDVTLNSPPHVGLALGGAAICVGGMLVFASLRDLRAGRLGLVLTVAITMATIIFAMFWAQPRLLWITLVDVLFLVLAAAIVRRPGWMLALGAAFLVLDVVDWFFAPWATLQYAQSLGLPLRDGVTVLPLMPIQYPMLLPLAAVLIELAMLIGRRTGLSPKSVIPVAGAVCAAVMLVGYHYQDVLFDTDRTPDLVDCAVGVVLALGVAWLGWWLASPLRRLSVEVTA